MGPPPAAAPPPITENPPIPDPNVGTNNPTSTPRAATPSQQAPGTGNTPPQETYPKVEGVIIAPPARTANTERPPTQSPARASDVYFSRELAIRPDELTIYEIHREADQPRSALRVIFYIAIVLAVLGYLLLMPQKKRQE